MDYNNVRIPVLFDAGEDPDWAEELARTDMTWRTSVPAIGSKLVITRPDGSFKRWRVVDVAHETHFDVGLLGYDITRVYIVALPAT